MHALSAPRLQAASLEASSLFFLGLRSWWRALVAVCLLCFLVPCHEFGRQGELIPVFFYFFASRCGATSPWSFDHPCSLAKLSKVCQSCSQFVFFGVAALSQLPGHFCSGLCFSCCWFPRFSVPFKTLHQIFLLTLFFWAQDRIRFIANLQS